MNRSYKIVSCNENDSYVYSAPSGHPGDQHLQWLPSLLKPFRHNCLHRLSLIVSADLEALLQFTHDFTYAN